MKKLLIIPAFLCLGLGTIGIAVPLLPTVPFLMLSSYCFMKSSKRLDKWFRGTRLYHRYLKCFLEERSMLLSAKLFILLPVSVIVTALMIRYDSFLVRTLLLLLLAVMYYVFFFKIKNGNSRERKAATSPNKSPDKPKCSKPNGQL